MKLLVKEGVWDVGQNQEEEVLGIKLISGWQRGPLDLLSAEQNNLGPVSWLPRSMVTLWRSESKQSTANCAVDSVPRLGKKAGSARSPAGSQCRTGVCSAPRRTCWRHLGEKADHGLLEGGTECPVLMLAEGLG